MFKYSEILKIDGKKLTKKYIGSLNKEEREALIDPIFDLMREIGFIYPDDEEKIYVEWERIKEYEPDLEADSIYNNSSVGTYICRYFCHSFYSATERKKPTLIDIFNDDEQFKKIIWNRLGLRWYTEENLHNENEECFNLSPKMLLFQGPRSARAVNATSMFKPIVYKYLVMKYTSGGDVCYDYSAGFGGRMLSTVAAGRKYLGVDPLTIDELINMKEFLELSGVELIDSISEKYVGEENSIDFSCSSPPYFDQEIYSNDDSQAYNNGEEYFFDTYWAGTLKNIRYMLKSGKYFGLNVTNVPKMVEMAIEVFGEPVEEVKLRTVKNHLNKKGKDDAIKYEPVYIFLNNK